MLIILPLRVALWAAHRVLSPTWPLSFIEKYSCTAAPIAFLDLDILSRRSFMPQRAPVGLWCKSLNTNSTGAWSDQVILSISDFTIRLASSLDIKI
ncbi:hypothetical protein FKM82_026015 [Ascaphus truei]